MRFSNAAIFAVLAAAPAFSLQAFTERINDDELPDEMEPIYMRELNKGKGGRKRKLEAKLSGGNCPESDKCNLPTREGQELESSTPPSPIDVSCCEEFDYRPGIEWQCNGLTNMAVAISQIVQDTGPPRGKTWCCRKDCLALEQAQCVIAEEKRYFTDNPLCEGRAPALGEAVISSDRTSSVVASGICNDASGPGPYTEVALETLPDCGMRVACCAGGVVGSGSLTPFEMLPVIHRELMDYEYPPSPSPTETPSDVPSDIPSEVPSDGPSVSELPTCKNGQTGAGCGGDPHFRTFNGGKRFSWHGEGDVVLLQNKIFRDSLGLDIHGRTTIMQSAVSYYSIIEAVAIRIGNFILEVSPEYYYINGVENAELPITVYGNILISKYVEEIKHLKRVVYEIHLAQDGIIKLTTFKNYVLVNVDDASESQFYESVGMLGTYNEGTLLARDGLTVIQDYDTLGDHWQVMESEPKLFQHLRAPQHPFEKPRMPPKDTHSSRRLRAAHGRIEEAEEACAHRLEDNEQCIFDVLATGDVDLAIGGEF